MSVVLKLNCIILYQTHVNLTIVNKFEVIFFYLFNRLMLLCTKEYKQIKIYELWLLYM